MIPRVGRGRREGPGAFGARRAVEGKRVDIFQKVQKTAVPIVLRKHSQKKNERQDKENIFLKHCLPPGSKTL
jgi:hypothetical protein